MSVYYHIRELVVEEFFPKGSETPENEKKTGFLFFHPVTKIRHNKIP